MSAVDSELVAAVLDAFDSDPVGAGVLIDEAVASYAYDLVVKNADVLEPLIRADVQNRVNVAKAAVGRSYVESVSKGEYPDGGLQQTAQWLAAMDAYLSDVSKADRREMWNLNGQSEQRWVSRGADGRFSAKVINTTQTLDPVGLHESKLSPSLTGSSLFPKGENGSRNWSESTDAASREKASRHQSQWDQANKYARDMYDAFPGDKKGVTVEVHVDRNGEYAPPLVFDLREARSGLPASLVHDINPVTDTLKAIRLRTESGAEEGAQERVRRFNMLGYLGAPEALQRLASVDTNSYSAAFGRSNPNNPPTASLFNRLRGASSVLGAAGMPKAAAFAALVGEMGPEAEAVLGPHVRQAAYRYRGTEKRPDAKLIRAFDSQEMRLIRGIADEKNIGANEKLLMLNQAAIQQRTGKDSSQGNPVLESAALRAGRGADSDQLKLQAASDAAVLGLMDTLPKDMFTARLSESSGHVLPSQGVIVDADGNLVSQAVGYADDHYLPFDLRNMPALRGGQYVRTRVAGGLTGEDIYASIQTGARMATVVSTSGVFSVEFDPAFRGARGNSDKAHQMYTRYLKILDAVKNSDMYIQDIPVEEKNKAADRARLVTADIPDKSLREDTFTAKQKEYVEQYRSASRKKLFKVDESTGRRTETSTEDLLKDARILAEQEPDFARSNSAAQSRAIESVYDDLFYRAQRNSVEELALNAAGYEKALETLQQQFPYFIRNVSYSPLRAMKYDPKLGFLEERKQPLTVGSRQSSSRRDSGYVSPGGLRPDSVENGFYRVEGPDRPYKGDKERLSAKTTVDRPSAPGGGAGAAGAGGAGSTGGSTPPASSSGAPKKSPLQESLEGMQQMATDQAAAGSERLQSQISILGLMNPHHTDDWTWEKARDSGKIDAAAWLVGHVADIPDLVQRDPAAATLLSDKKLFGQAIGTRFNGANFADLEDKASIDEVFPDGITDDKGAVSADKVMAHMLESAKSAASAGSILNPFADTIDANPLFDSGKPRPPQESTRLHGVSSRKSLDEFMSTSEGQALAGAESSLGSDPAAASKKMLADLNRLSEYHDAARKEVAESGDMDAFPKVLAKLSGLKESRIEELLGGAPDVASLGVDRINQAAERVQQAWTLSQVRRSIDVIEGDDETGPKVRPVVKAYSSRWAVVSKEHRLAQLVRMGQAAGLIG